MEDIIQVNNPYHDDKVIDACSIFGAMDTLGKRFSGEGVIRAIANMHDRGNGLGGGFAIYGLYPEYADFYAFHIMYLGREGQRQTEAFLEDRFNLVRAEAVPTHPTSAIVDPPLVWRYFLEVGRHQPDEQSQDDYVVDRVMEINTQFQGAFGFSGVKDMAVCK